MRGWCSYLGQGLMQPYAPSLLFNVTDYLVPARPLLFAVWSQGFWLGLPQHPHTHPLICPWPTPACPGVIRSPGRHPVPAIYPPHANLIPVLCCPASVPKSLLPPCDNYSRFLFSASSVVPSYHVAETYNPPCGRSGKDLIQPLGHRSRRMTGKEGNYGVNLDEGTGR